jgi:hypothetical protein
MPKMSDTVVWLVSRTVFVFVIVMIATESCSGHWSIEARYADPTSLESVDVDTSKSLSTVLQSFRPVRTRNQRDSATRADGVLELFSATPDDDRRITRAHWKIYAYVRVYASAKTADESARRLCLRNRSFKPEDLRYQEWPDSFSCVSPIARIASDPEGGCLPTDKYESFAVVRQGNLVVDLEGIRKGRSAETLTWAIEAIAADLSARDEKGPS